MNATAQSSGPTLSAGDLSRIAKLLKRDAGIEIPEGKASLVQARLSRRLRDTGLSSYADYCTLLEGPDGSHEREHMLSALTTNVTKFFREDHHFKDLRDRLLPPLLEKARACGSVRLWSAGCSSGEEPYSIAVTLLMLDGRAADYNIRILATDIDPRMVEAGRSGVYKTSSITPFDGRDAKGWFEKVDDMHMRAKPALQKLVTFNRLNLHSDWPMKRPIDIIFCRNVVIYFDKSDETNLWKRMIRSLSHNGWILVGHSERIPAHPDLPVTLDGITTYRRNSASNKQET